MTTRQIARAYGNDDVRDADNDVDDDDDDEKEKRSLEVHDIAIPLAGVDSSNCLSTFVISVMALHKSTIERVDIL